MAISIQYSNSKDVTTATLAAQAAAATYRQDFKDGYRRFWKNEPLSFCANGVERAGYWAAADEQHDEIQHAREHAADMRQTMGN